MKTKELAMIFKDKDKQPAPAIEWVDWIRIEFHDESIASWNHPMMTIEDYVDLIIMQVLCNEDIDDWSSQGQLSFTLEFKNHEKHAYQNRADLKINLLQQVLNRAFPQTILKHAKSVFPAESLVKKALKFQDWGTDFSALGLQASMVWDPSKKPQDISTWNSSKPLDQAVCVFHLLAYEGSAPQIFNNTEEWPASQQSHSFILVEQDLKCMHEMMNQFFPVTPYEFKANEAWDSEFISFSDLTLTYMQSILRKNGWETKGSMVSMPNVIFNIQKTPQSKPLNEIADQLKTLFKWTTLHQGQQLHFNEIKKMVPIDNHLSKENLSRKRLEIRTLEEKNILGQCLKPTPSSILKSKKL